jgi:hypothetical protein
MANELETKRRQLRQRITEDRKQLAILEAYQLLPPQKLYGILSRVVYRQNKTINGITFHFSYNEELSPKTAVCSVTSTYYLDSISKSIIETYLILHQKLAKTVLYKSVQP